MRIYKTKNYDEMSCKAAGILAAQMILKPNSVLGLATGSTPLGIYKELIDRHQKGDLDFSEITSINLDEYKGLAGDHPQSYRWFMQQNLFGHVNIRPENTHVPNGLAEDAQAECARYDEIIYGCGGIDLQLLGLGHNGHIGFNEPDDAFAKDTHLVALSDTTIQANTRFFSSSREVPRFAFTMGIRSIMSARQILVVVSGKDKADIVKEAFFGPVTPSVPASILQMHGNVILVADEDALCKLR